MKAAASALISFLSFLLVASAQDLGSVITQSLFNEMLKHRSDAKCHGGFYTYNAFITAAKSFSGFGASGNIEQRKRDVAAFFAQTSEVTEGLGVFAKDDPYTWGYCWVKERDVTVDYCTPLFPCAPGRKYFGRGPFQIRGNYEYLNAGKAIGADLIKNPDFVATDPVISFKTAIWYWMTPRSQTKPSLHNVMTGIWKPSAEDIAAHRLPGFGVTTNILNDVECGTGADQRSESRINYYKRYCNLLGVSPGDNLECDTQAPFE